VTQLVAVKCTLMVLFAFNTSHDISFKGLQHVQLAFELKKVNYAIKLKLFNDSFLQ